VKGDLGVDTGRLNLDEILASRATRLRDERDEYLTKASARISSRPRLSPFDALKVDVRLTVPDDLVNQGEQACRRRIADRPGARST